MAQEYLPAPSNIRLADLMVVVYLNWSSSVDINLLIVLRMNVSQCKSGRTFLNGSAVFAVGFTAAPVGGKRPE